MSRSMPSSPAAILLASSPVDDAGEPVLPGRYLNLQVRVAVSLQQDGAEGQ